MSESHLCSHGYVYGCPTCSRPVTLREQGRVYDAAVSKPATAPAIMSEDVTPRLRQLIAEIVDGLFTNGSGQKADRLVLTVDGSSRDLGGLCRAAVVNRLEAALFNVLSAGGSAPRVDPLPEDESYWTPYRIEQRRKAEQKKPSREEPSR